MSTSGSARVNVVSPSISPISPAFRQWVRTNRKNPAYAHSPHTVSDEGICPFQKRTTSTYSRGVGSPAGQKCGPRFTAAAHYPADPFRHSMDLFRQWALDTPPSTAYANTAGEYREQGERKSSPAVRTVLAPPRGIWTNTSQPFGQM